jgi:hypothetical protein
MRYKGLKLFAGFLTVLMSMLVAIEGSAQTSPPTSITNASWVSMGTKPIASITAITNVITDPSSGHRVCYLGGYFSQIGGIAASHIAKFDVTTSTFSALGTGTNDAVMSLVVDPVTGNLYAGGYFTLAGEVANTSCIAKWNPATSTWSALGTGIRDGFFDIVNALAFDGTNLYVGGDFAEAGGVADTSCIAKWNPATSTWSPLGTGMDESVLALTVVGTDLYAGGYFDTAGETNVGGIAKWNGTEWSALGTGTDGVVRALVFDGSYLYAGGFFKTAGGVQADSIAMWDDEASTWSPLGEGIVNQTVYSLAVDSSGFIYAGGLFTSAGIVKANNIAQWDNASGKWYTLGSGTNSYVMALVLDGASLYAGGYFTLAGGKTSYSLAKCSVNGTTVPLAPTAVVAVAGDSEAEVSFVVVDNVANPIISCTVTSTPENIRITVPGAPSSINVPGLTNGKSYTFKVTATNSLGKGPASASSNSVKPSVQEVPDAPGMGTVTAGTGQATIHFTAPKDKGSGLISSYTVTSVVPAGISVSRAGSTTTPITVYNLTAGTSYTFVVQATNSAGTSLPSAISASVTPTSGVPGAPTIGIVTRGDTEATITFTPPTNNGGSSIIHYTAISTPEGKSATILVTGVAPKPITVGNLTNGKSYTFKVQAENTAGYGPLSAASKAVIPCRAPDAPTNVVATAGAGQATVAFTAPVTNGSAIISYTVTSSPGGKTATANKTKIIVNDLTNGTPYTFTVRATNGAGTGVPSLPSNSVTPVSEITTATVTGATVPVVGAVAAVAIDATTQYNAAPITWTPGLVGGKFDGGIAYTAEFTIAAKTGYTVVGVAANFFKVAGATAKNSAGSGLVTAVFPKTGITITTGAIDGVTVPVTGATPKTTVTATTDYTGKIAWAPELLSGKFAPNTPYTATITIKPKTNYTVVGVLANSFTVAGATTVTNPADSGVVTAVFPATVKSEVTSIGVIAGTAKVGNVLTAGALTPAAATVDYQWKRCFDEVDPGINIGTNAKTYTLVDADVDTYIRVQATGKDNYSGTQTSAAKGIVLPTVPGEPIIGIATAGNGQATVLFSAPITTGGREITQYTATSNPSGKIGTSTSTPGGITVTGLKNGTTYTFRVKAKSNAGTGASSDASNAVTPFTP